MLDAKLPEIHPDFKLNGEHLEVKDMYPVCYSFVKEGMAYEELLGNFLLDWLNESYETIKLRTSGTTGAPKEIFVEREKMVASANFTGETFKLPPKSRVLCCIPANNVAGRMMLIRAMVLGWHLDLVEPKVKALDEVTKKYNFCALTPLQLSNSLHKLHLIEKVIVGGAPVSLHLKKALVGRSTKVYETFGMTETISHVAYRRINSRKKEKSNPNFKAIGDVQFSVDKRSCLVIHSEKLLDKSLVTNDIVDLIDETHFVWKGREGNLINSGGVKIHPEEVEKKIEPLINSEFIIAPKEDKQLGEKLILIVKNNKGIPSSEELEKNIKALKTITKFEVPKEIHFVDEFERTRTKKIDRKASVEALFSLVK